MNFPSQPRVFISGAGSGLGRVFALSFARLGGRVLVTDLSLESAERTAREVVSAGGEAEALRCDVTQPDALEAAADALEKRWGGVDVVINNAGVAVAGKVGEAPLADWDWIFRINFWGVLHGCHTFVPRLKRSGGGFILNVASAAGFASLPQMAAYNATKSAVIALSETLHAEVGGDGIHVSVLCPTFFRSGILDGLRAPTDEGLKIAEAMMKRSKVSAEDAADAALRGLERGTLHIVPQMDGRAIWRFKRLFPAGYFRLLRKRHVAAFKWLASSAAD